MSFSAPQEAVVGPARDATRSARSTYGIGDRVPWVKTFDRGRKNWPSPIGQEKQARHAMIPGPAYGTSGTSCGTHGRPL